MFNLKLSALALSVGLAILSTTAQANPHISIIEPTINTVVGGTSTFTANISDNITISPPPSAQACYPGCSYTTGESFSILSSQFTSGDGQTVINGPLTQSFTYNNAGTFTPSFSAVVGIYQTYTIGVPSYTPDYGEQCCMFFFETSFYTTNLNANGHSVTVWTSVPEPESYAMMLAGLGLLGFMARRKKNV